MLYSLVEFVSMHKRSLWVGLSIVWMNCNLQKGISYGSFNVSGLCIQAIDRRQCEIWRCKNTMVALISAARAVVFFRTLYSTHCEFLQLFNTPHIPKM